MGDGGFPRGGGRAPGKESGARCPVLRRGDQFFRSRSHSSSSWVRAEVPLGSTRELRGGCVHGTEYPKTHAEGGAGVRETATKVNHEGGAETPPDRGGGAETGDDTIRSPFEARPSGITFFALPTVDSSAKSPRAPSEQARSGPGPPGGLPWGPCRTPAGTASPWMLATRRSWRSSPAPPEPGACRFMAGGQAGRVSCED